METKSTLYVPITPNGKAEDNMKDPKELLAQLDADEKKAKEDFEAKQKEKREKALEGILNPLKKERSDAAQQVNELNSRMSEIDKQISSLTGQKQRTSGGKRRKRMSEDEKLDIAKLMVGNMTKGKEYSAGELSKSTDSVPVRDIVRIWNENNKDKKLKVTGSKATTRYIRE